MPNAGHLWPGHPKLEIKTRHHSVSAPCAMSEGLEERRRKGGQWGWKAINTSQLTIRQSSSSLSAATRVTQIDYVHDSRGRTSSVPRRPLPSPPLVSPLTTWQDSWQCIYRWDVKRKISQSLEETRIRRVDTDSDLRLDEWRRLGLRTTHNEDRRTFSRSQ